MPYLLLAVVFASVSLAAYGMLSVLFAEDRQVSRRLRDLTTYEVREIGEAQPLLRPFAERVVKPVGTAAAGLARKLTPVGYTARAKDRLSRAGYPRGMGLERLMLAKAAALLGGGGFAIALAAVAGWGLGGTLLGTAVIGLAAFYLPDVWLNRRIEARQHRIVLELPDTLDMLTISVEAGLGFDAALVKLIRSRPGALSVEFGRVLQEIQAGASRKEALRGMADRLDIPELSAFAASIVQADIFGVSIAKVLRTQAGEMRLRRRQRAEEQAQKAPVKMVIPLVLCILPATIIVVGGPAVVRIAALFGS